MNAKIELLVVVIIIGVLSAIALPNLLANIGKAKETEAVMAASTFIKAQSLYRYEKGEFTSDWSDLGIDPKANNFTYELAVSNNEARFIAVPKNEDTRAVGSGVMFNATNQDVISGICKATKPGKEFAVINEVLTDANNRIVRCGKGLKKA